MTDLFPLPRQSSGPEKVAPSVSELISPVSSMADCHSGVSVLIFHFCGVNERETEREREREREREAKREIVIYVITLFWQPSTVFRARAEGNGDKSLL